MSSLIRFRNRALACPEVNKAYDDVAEEFASLDEGLKARAEADHIESFDARDGESA
jgi:hypothetical protein